MVYQKKRQIKKGYEMIQCSLESGNQLGISKPKENGKGCKIWNTTEHSDIHIIPKYERSTKLEKGMIDLNALNVLMVKPGSVLIHLMNFKGFELNLFDDSTNLTNQELKIKLSLNFNDFDFFLGEKKIVSCQDFIEATNSSNNPRSILQVSSIIYIYKIIIYLTETKNKLCPLAWKNFSADKINIYGENSFYSKRVLSFSNETFPNLNSRIVFLTINVPNVELDTSFLHPDVFSKLKMIVFEVKVNFHPDVFIKMDYLVKIFIRKNYLKSTMHSSGIEWIKNLNRDINLDTNNLSQVYYHRERLKSVCFECISPIHLFIDLFPEEDFCLYRDFPINQLVTIIHDCDNIYILEYTLDIEIPCTYLWITRSYKSLVKIMANKTSKISIDYLLNSSDFKSIEKCNFEQKLQLCNKSNFVPKYINTYYDIKIAVYITQIILNILSYMLPIFGIVTNLLVIITISSKKNKEEFKDIKQYEYLRMNSICNCLILLIHMISWLNECIYPFQVFCPIIRKTIFMQWFKIIVQETFMTALKFMNNFTYVGFAFNRISLIGKDHNKMVKFMSDLGIKKYIVFSLFISFGLSVIKVFEYDINPGFALFSYPISYDYNYARFKQPNSIFYIFSFISDLFNHVVFLLINLAIDIGLIVKLRQTLNEMLEKAKVYSTKAQQEAKNKENENVMNNARSMIIWNTSLNLILKLPSALYSFFYLYAHVLKPNINDHLVFFDFFFYVCIEADFCNMFIQLSDFLYFICISIQLFFYKHYDKKFAQSFKKVFVDMKAKTNS